MFSQFLSTLSLRRATSGNQMGTFGPRDFYPRSPCGERRGIFMQIFRRIRYFYPRSPCGERPVSGAYLYGKYFISIHALLAESDDWQPQHQVGHRDFYPRSPCGERQRPIRCHAKNLAISIHALLAESDPSSHSFTARAGEFLSTLSLRRATAKVHKTMGHFCTYETNFMGIASSC